MSSVPLVPLRWYEHLLLRFLAASPRITKLMVIQDPADPFLPLHPDDMLPPVGLDTSPDGIRMYADYLEDLYRYG